MSRRLPPIWRARATIDCLVAPPLVHWIAIPRLVRGWIGGTPRGTDPTVDDDSIVEWVDWLLQRLPWPWEATCLKRSLVLFGLLRHAGRPADLVIGVRRALDRKLEAHAWLERDGKLCYEPPQNTVDSYRAIDRYTGQAP